MLSLSTPPPTIPVELVNLPQAAPTTNWEAIIAVVATVVVAVAGFIVNPLIEKGKWLRATRQAAYSQYYADNTSAFNKLVTLYEVAKSGKFYSKELKELDEKLDAQFLSWGRCTLLCDDDMETVLKMNSWLWTDTLKEFHKFARSDETSRPSHMAEVDDCINALKDASAGLMGHMRLEIGTIPPLHQRLAEAFKIAFAKNSAKGNKA